MRIQRSHSALCLSKFILENVYRFLLDSSAVYSEVPALNAGMKMSASLCGGGESPDN